MKLVHPTPDEGLQCLRAMRTVVARAGVVPPASRALMNAAQKMLMALDVDLDSLPPITPDELKRRITTPGLGEQLVQGMIVNILADGEPDPAAFERLQSFATALGISIPALRTVRLFIEKNMLLFRLDFMRRSHIADMVKDTYRHHGGLRAVAEALLGLRGMHEDKALAARFLALGDLPKDTLGYAYFDHCRSHGFAFPGERNGFPLAGVYHDMAHVLSGYGTAPEEELLVGAFSAAFKKTNPFYLLLLVSFLWGAGINVTPLAQPHLPGLMAKDGLAERFLQALDRGGRVNTDLSDNWDFWPYLPLPLPEARQRLGITEVERQS